jgi:ubiquinone/menaquinone biosynthesis C-methylase UbiE
MNHKETTIATYDTPSYADDYDFNTKRYIERCITSEADYFIRNLKGKKVLDIGAGTGNHAEHLSKKGLDVTCADLSIEMLKKCEEKGLKTMQIDFENFKIEKNSYDGVWTYCALLHTPKKNLSIILDNIKPIIKRGGYLFLGMKEGDFDGYKNAEKKYPNQQRYFALYDLMELYELLEKKFKLEFASRTITKDNKMYLNYICKKE